MYSRPHKFVHVPLVSRVLNAQTLLEHIFATHVYISVVVLPLPIHVLDHSLHRFQNIDLSWQIMCVLIPVVDCTLGSLPPLAKLGKVMFFLPHVCLSSCKQDISKSYEPIFTNFNGHVGDAARKKLYKFIR